MGIYQTALIGCGDYLRWEIDRINDSKLLNVKYTFDLDRKKAEIRAKELGAVVIDDVDAIFADEDIKMVLIFTPPWARLELFEKAVKTKKHIITTKPLSNNLEDANKLYDMVKGEVTAAVFYGRAGNEGAEMLKTIFDGGEIGKLAIYKEDWFHHYPQWNSWATDPKLNGGPFMDAMVHNLNKSRYLIGGEVERIDFKSENYAQRLKCNDTEFANVYFKNGGTAQLFITWAANLDVYSKGGNDREHYGITHMITDQGWYVEEIEKDGIPYIKAHRNGEIKEWKVEALAMTPYDDVVHCIENNLPQNHSLDMAITDIKLMNS